MPGGSKYAGPSAALEAYRSVVAASQSGAEVKGAKNPYTSRRGHMFSFLDADGTMALRLSDELTGEFRSSFEIAWRFGNGWRIGLEGYHLSNADLAAHNPGNGSLLLALIIPVGPAH